MPSRSFRDICALTKDTDAPTAVRAHVNMVASSAPTTGCRLSRNAIIRRHSLSSPSEPGRATGS